MPLSRTPRPLPRRVYPPGVRKGAVVNPERDPVQPEVPGTRDRIRPPQATTDPEVKALRLEMVKLDKELEKLEEEIADTHGRKAKNWQDHYWSSPKKQARYRKMLERRDAIESQLA